MQYDFGSASSKECAPEKTPQIPANLKPLEALRKLAEDTISFGNHKIIYFIRKNRTEIDLSFKS